MSSTPPPLPPRKPPPPPPPPSSDPPPDPAGSRNPWDAAFLDGPPTSTVPRYDTEKFGAVRGSRPVDDAYGFPIDAGTTADPASSQYSVRPGDTTGIDPTAVISAVGQDADGDGVLDSVQEAEAAAAYAAEAESQAAAASATGRTDSPTILRRRRSPWPTVIALVGPFLLILIALTFIGSALGSGDGSSSDESSSTESSSGESDNSDGESSDDTADSSDSSGADQPAAPPVVIASSGDPLADAIRIATDHAVAASSEAPVTPQVIAVRSDPIGPDQFALRLVIIRYVGSSENPTAKIACADWDVNATTGEVIELGETTLGEAEGRVDVPTREIEFRTNCDAATIG